MVEGSQAGHGATLVMVEVSFGHQRRFSQNATLTKAMSAGTSASGPMTAAKAAPCVRPKK